MKKLILIAFVALCAGTTAFAQVEKGDVNISGSLSYQKFSDVDGTGIFEAKGGYFFSQHLEGGANIMLLFSDGNTGFGLGPYASYNFLTEDAKLLPYVGANFLLFAIDGTSITSIGVNGGAKYFLTETINVDAGISLQQAFGDLDGSLFTMRIGIGFLLGKLK